MSKTLAFLSIVFVILAGGCGGQRGRISGTIRYQGKPVTNATAIFMASDNQTYPVRLKDDGSYQVASLPYGHITVSIQGDLEKVAPAPPPGKAGKKEDEATAKMIEEDRSKGRKPADLPSNPKPLASISAIPPLYADPKQSGLGFDLTSPDQDFSVDLK